MAIQRRTVLNVAGNGTGKEWMAGKETFGRASAVQDPQIAMILLSWLGRLRGTWQHRLLREHCD
jgi:hypothetical protein